jgi:hypothetical protein
MSFEHILRALAHGTIIASFNIESFSLDRLRTLKRREVDKRHAEFVRMIRVHDAIDSGGHAAPKKPAAKRAAAKKKTAKKAARRR